MERSVPWIRGAWWGVVEHVLSDRETLRLNFIGGGV